MPSSMEQVTKDALGLSSRQRLMLAELLLESNETEIQSEADAAWDVEIQERIRAIDEGRVAGVPHEDVMQAADKLLAR